MTTAKSTERALAEITAALDRDHDHPLPGVHAHLTAAHVQLIAVARLLQTAA